MSENIKKILKKKWQKIQAQKKWLKNFPDQNPVLVQSKKEKHKTGVYFLKPYILDYRQMAANLLKDRNKTIKQNFVWYCLVFLSTLVEKSLSDEDEILSDEEKETQIYSLNLKKLNRNYSLFNDLLLKEGILEFIDQYDADEGKCISYGICTDFIFKGVCREYLSKSELKRLINGVRLQNLPDKTSSNNPDVVKKFIGTLEKTKINKTDLLKLEIEAGRFVTLYRYALRFMSGKYDAKIGKNDGRCHANYTYAPSEFRSLMRYGGKQAFVEGDVAACHFHFLLDEMADPDERSAMLADLAATDPYLAMCGNPAGVKRADLKQSSHIFKFGSRRDVRIFVSDNKATKIVPYRKGLFYRYISAKYPHFAEFMARKRITHKIHKKEYACALMKREAGVMVHAVGTRCAAEGLIYLPVHDGFLTLPRHYDQVCEIVGEAYRAASGSVPRIRRK